MRMFYLAFLFLGIDMLAFGGFVIDENHKDIRGRRWPHGIIPFKISPNFKSEQILRIKKVVEDYNRHTVLTWKEWEGEEDYVEFVETNGNAAGSGLGMLKGRQEIRIRERENPDVIAHEMGHTIGLLHEHSRPDIADHLIFRGDMNNERDAICYKIFFENKDDRGLMNYDDYNHFSVMRLNNFCTIGGHAPVINRNPPPQLPADWDWNRRFLSPGDIKTINSYYLDESIRDWPEPESCRDHMACNIFKQNGDCQNYSMQHVAYWQCAKTCNLCKTSEMTYQVPEIKQPDQTPSECSNKKSQLFCDLGSTMDVCSHSPGFADDCGLSCGLCKGSSRVRVVVDDNGLEDSPWCGGWVKYPSLCLSNQTVREQCPTSCRIMLEFQGEYDKYNDLH